MEKELLDQFIRRVAYGKNIKKIDSLGAHTGEPFYFYCDNCGVPTEAFPERPIAPVESCCSQCRLLLQDNLMDTAKMLAQKFFCISE